MKKNYQKPTMLVVNILHQSQILAGSDTGSFGSIGGGILEYGGASDNFGQVR